MVVFQNDALLMSGTLDQVIDCLGMHTVVVLYPCRIEIKIVKLVDTVHSVAGRHRVAISEIHLGIY